MNKKILIFIFGIFLLMIIPLISAADWDNKLTYSNKDLKVNFSNSFLGIFETSEIGSIELKSHSSVTEIKKVGAGDNKAVMYYEINFKELYENGLGEVLFIDMRTGEEIEKSYYFAELIIEQRPKYKSICEEIITENGTESSECYQIKDGFEKVEIWKKLNSNEIPKGKATIGLVTDVENGDYIDAIWEIVGKKVSKHASWTADLNVDLDLYYKLDEPSGTIVLNEVGTNGSNIGADVNQAGKINKSYNFVRVSENLGDFVYFNGTDFNVDDWTFNAWVNPDVFNSGTNEENIILNSNGPATADGMIGWNMNNCGSTNSSSSKLGKYYGTTTCLGTEEWITGVWQMTTIINDGTNNRTLIYRNANLIYNESGVTIKSATIGLLSARDDTSGTNMRTFDGKVDEVGVWYRSLTTTEIIQLYNNTFGITFQNIFVTLNSPLNNTISTSKTINFNGTISGNPLNVSLIIDDVYNETNTSGILGNYLFTKNLTDGTYTWNYETCNTQDCFNGTERTLTINTKSNVNLTSPLDGANTTSTQVSFISSVSTPNLNLDNVSLYINGILNQTNSSGIEGNYNFTESLAEQNLNWSIEACNSGVCTLSEERNLIIHLTSPTINITNPIGTYDYFLLGNNESLNWSISEPGTNLSEHIINCSYDYNGTITYLSINTCVNINQTNFIYARGIENLSFTVVDIFGLINTVETNWDYKILQNSVSFENSTIEGATESFILNFSLGGILQASTVTLIYDDVEYSSTFLSVGNNVITNNDISIPNVNATENKTFYWSIMLSDSSIINTTNYNQSVVNLDIGNCSDFTTLIFNYTQKDEEEQTNLTENDVEISIDIFDSTRESIIVNFSDSYSDINPIQICINVNLTENTNYSVDSVVKYTSNESTGYTLEYYNLLNFILSNSTIPQNTNLYSLLDDDSTEFQLTFRDSNLALAPDILVSVNRQYVSDNDFKTVEIPVTDSNGQAILHLVRNDIQYNFIMTDENGEIIGVFNKKNVFCEDFTIGSCTLNLNALATQDTLYKPIQDVGIIYTRPEYSNITKILTFEFISIDLTSKKVTIKVTRDTDFGNRTVCEESLISSSGIISCDVSTASDTDNFLFVDISVNDVQKATETINLEGSKNMGITGFFLAFFVILLMFTIFMDDKKMLVISLMIGWVVVISLGLVGGSLFGSLSAGVWLLVTVIIFIWKLNKEDSI